MRLLLKNKEIKNAGWLITGKILQMLISFVVGIFSARYLGPSNYGLLSYATTYVTFFLSICSLGINAVIIKDFYDHPDEQGTAIGTTFVLRLISGILSILTLFFLISWIDRGEATTIAVVVLCSLSLVFNIFDTLNCWFHYMYKAKIVAISSFVAYVVMAIYKIYLLIAGKSILWFALATSIDYIVIALVLLASYRHCHGPHFGFSWEKGKYLLSKSYPYILSGMLTTVYAQTDKMMLKQMMGVEEVGYYSMAVSISGIWTFVLAAIIDAVFPTLYRIYDENRCEFDRRNRQLYATVIYMSVAVSIVFVLIGEHAIRLLYGEEYLPAMETLKIITWGTAFSYLGVARHAWIVCKNAQKYLTSVSLIAALLNVIMNFGLIPLMGAPGAAVASVVAQICTSIVIPVFIKELRPNVRLIFEAIALKDIFYKKHN